MLLPLGVSTSIGSAKSLSPYLSICSAILLLSASADNLGSSSHLNCSTSRRMLDIAWVVPSSLMPLLPPTGAIRIAMRRRSKISHRQISSSTAAMSSVSWAISEDRLTSL